MKPQSTPRWSPWRPFPDPRRCAILHAPIGHGVYEIRRARTGRLILFGRSTHVAARMTSLLPKPLGTGGRRNDAKRDYVLCNIASLEYRTLPCPSRADAIAAENRLRHAARYLFHT